jgi:membrane protein DedA with SNARE-associated domain
MAVMAGILVWLGQGNITETIVVILGCLSYNLVLYWVGVEVSAGIRKSGHKPEA